MSQQTKDDVNAINEKGKRTYTYCLTNTNTPAHPDFSNQYDQHLKSSLQSTFSSR